MTGKFDFNDSSKAVQSGLAIIGFIVLDLTIDHIG